MKIKANYGILTAPSRKVCLVFLLCQGKSLHLLLAYVHLSQYESVPIILFPFLPTMALEQ